MVGPRQVEHLPVLRCHRASRREVRRKQEKVARQRHRQQNCLELDSKFVAAYVVIILRLYLRHRAQSDRAFFFEATSTRLPNASARSHCHGTQIDRIENRAGGQ